MHPKMNISRTSFQDLGCIKTIENSCSKWSWCHGGVLNLFNINGSICPKKEVKQLRFWGLWGLQFFTQS